jgi:hypothetical protein
MHDKNGTPLRNGDTVLIEATIIELLAADDYCNVSLETVAGRRPDGQKERIYAINTGVLVLKDHPVAEVVDVATQSQAA